MFRSIRWTLLFWYAVIIVTALSALGWTLLAELERRLYEQADEQLAFWLKTAHHEVDEVGDATVQEKLALTLPSGAAFGIWDAAGARTAWTEDEATTAVPEREGAETRGHVRVNARRLDDGGWILVGMNVEDEHHRVRDFLYVLLLASAIIVAVALGGGWILISRALAPVGNIARTARRISGDNMGERIDTNDIKNELAGLAETLNESFDRLESAVDRQARFTADASHELRTPLAIISSHLELAGMGPHSEAQLRERIAISHDAARRMRSVVEGLLTLSRADAGGAELRRARVDLRGLLEEVRASVAPLAAERDVTVEHQIEAATVSGDPERLREAVTNLYTNAIRHGDVGGRVSVTLERDGDDALLEVSDGGPGIGEEHLRHIFERFYRVDEARAGGGSGLGLAITRWIVELHEGSIDVASRPGEGTRFTVRLPVA